MIAPQGLEIGEKLQWKYDETPLKRRCHERDYTRFIDIPNDFFLISPFHELKLFVVSLELINQDSYLKFLSQQRKEHGDKTVGTHVIYSPIPPPPPPPFIKKKNFFLILFKKKKI